MSNDGLVVQNNNSMTAGNFAIELSGDDKTVIKWLKFYGKPTPVMANCSSMGKFLIADTDFSRSSIDIVVIQYRETVGDFFNKNYGRIEWGQLIFAELKSGLVCSMYVKTQSREDFVAFSRRLMGASELTGKRIEDKAIRLTMIEKKSKRNEKYHVIGYEAIGDSEHGNDIRAFKEAMKANGIYSLVEWPTGNETYHEYDDTQDTAEPIIIGTGEHSVKVTGDPMSRDNVIIRINAMLTKLNEIDHRNTLAGEVGWRTYNELDLMDYFYRLNARVGKLTGDNKPPQPQAPSFFG